MRKTLLLLALVAAPLQAQTGAQIVPQLLLDKAGSSRAISVRDPVTSANRPIGTIDGSGYHPTPNIATNPVYPSTFYAETGTDPNNAMTNERLAVQSTGTHGGTRYGKTIEVRAQGSGVASCPQCADYGLGISVFKNNWDKLPTNPAHPLPGEMDGITIWGRQADGDFSGILADIQIHRAFGEILEGSVTRLTDAGAPIAGVRAYVAANNGYPGALLPAKGFATLCDAGTCDVAYYAGPLGGHFKWFLYNDHLGSSQPNFTVDEATADLVSAGAGRFGGDVTTAGNVIVTGGVEAGSFVDFHTTGVTNDFDARMLVSGGMMGTSGKGTLSIAAAALSVPTLIVSTGVISMPEVIVSTVATPASGTQTLFLDGADHKLKRKDSSGTVTIIG